MGTLVRTSLHSCDNSSGSSYCLFITKSGSLLAKLVKDLVSNQLKLKFL